MIEPASHRRTGLLLGILIALACVGSVLVFVCCSPGLQQRRIVAALTARGAVVAYDVQAKTRSKRPAWLVKLVGVDFFRDVFGVTVYDATDKDLIAISGLKSVRHVNLFGEQITDAGLAELRRLPRLEGLNLVGGPFTGRGLSELAGTSHLTDLLLNGSEITDDGLAGLDGHSNLDGLNLQAPKITDAGIPHVCRLAGLRVLILGTPKVTAKGMQEIRTVLPRCDVRK